MLASDGLHVSLDKLSAVRSRRSVMPTWLHQVCPNATGTDTLWTSPTWPWTCWLLLGRLSCCTCRASHCGYELGCIQVRVLHSHRGKKSNWSNSNKETWTKRKTLGGKEPWATFKKENNQNNTSRLEQRYRSNYQRKYRTCSLASSRRHRQYTHKPTYICDNGEQVDTISEGKITGYLTQKESWISK